MTILALARTFQRAAAALHRRRPLLALMLAALAAAQPPSAQAETATDSGSNVSNTASASLRFAINIDKFVYLRVGNVGAGGANINTVGFTLTPSIPAAPTTPIAGNNRSVNWSGAAPTVSVAAVNNQLPVEVRSNGGTVSLRATTLTALSNGSATIPMSQITVSSSDSALPAPPIDGASTTVTGSAFGNRVTTRTANWTFGYAPATPPRAGSYTGQVRFTASVP